MRKVEVTPGGVETRGYQRGFTPRPRARLLPGEMLDVWVGGGWSKVGKAGRELGRVDRCCGVGLGLDLHCKHVSEFLSGRISLRQAGFHLSCKVDYLRLLLGWARCPMTGRISSVRQTSCVRQDLICQPGSLILGRCSCVRQDLLCQPGSLISGRVSYVRQELLCQPGFLQSGRIFFDN